MSAKAPVSRPQILIRIIFCTDTFLSDHFESAFPVGMAKLSAKYMYFWDGKTHFLLLH